MLDALSSLGASTNFNIDAAISITSQWSQSRTHHCPERQNFVDSEGNKETLISLLADKAQLFYWKFSFLIHTESANGWSYVLCSF